MTQGTNTATHSSDLACFRIGAITLAALVAGGAALAWSIDHATEIGRIVSEIWRLVSAALSFGGHFWAAAAVSSVMLTASLSSACAAAKAEGGNARWLCLAGIAALLYVLAYASMQSTFASFDALTTYAKVATVGLSVSLAILVLLTFLALLSLTSAFTSEAD